MEELDVKDKIITFLKDDTISLSSHTKKDFQNYAKRYHQEKIKLATYNKEVSSKNKKIP